MPRRRARATPNTPACQRRSGTFARGSPLRLGTIHDVDHQIIQGLAASHGFLAGVVVSSHNKTVPLPEGLSLLLIENLHRDGDLDLAASDRHPAAITSGVRDRKIRLVPDDGA